VRDAWPVRRQIYGYLPSSHRASPPFDFISRLQKTVFKSPIGWIFELYCFLDLFAFLGFGEKPDLTGFGISTGFELLDL